MGEHQQLFGNTMENGSGLLNSHDTNSGADTNIKLCFIRFLTIFFGVVSPVIAERGWVLGSS